MNFFKKYILTVKFTFVGKSNKCEKQFFNI